MSRFNHTDTKERDMDNPMNEITTEQAPLSKAVLSSVILDGDLANLKPAERVDYMLTVCRTLGLNPTTRPFDFMRFQGKLVMYARRDCADQLRKIHKVSITIKLREQIDDLYMVTANAQDGQGRVDEATGIVCIRGLQAESLANALMKAETKAKRRVTLSICGLGLLDETELENQTPVAPQSMTTVEASTVAASDNPADMPKHDDDARNKAQPMWVELRGMDKEGQKAAAAIKRKHGTDYAAMIPELEQALLAADERRSEIARDAEEIAITGADDTKQNQPIGGK